MILVQPHSLVYEAKFTFGFDLDRFARTEKILTSRPSKSTVVLRIGIEDNPIDCTEQSANIEALINRGVQLTSDCQ